MVGLGALWLPIVLSAALVFVVSSIVHMVLPIHRGDYGRLPAEDALLAALRQHGLPPGQFMFPCPGSMREMATPAMQERFREGPVGHMVVRPNGAPAIGRSLLLWFLFTLAVGFCVAYVAAQTLLPGTDFLRVLRVTGTVAFLPYAVAYAQDSIWKGIRWRTSAKFVFDGILYALVTGATFAWLWPAA